MSLRNFSLLIYMKSLHKYGIYHNNIKRALFDNFLLQPEHSHFLQQFLIFCYTQDDRIHGIIKAFEFTLNGGYTYAQLFHILPAWHDFFKENAEPSGIPINNEDRVGTDRQDTDHVMRCYYSTDIRNLDNAIVLAMQEKIELLHQGLGAH